MSDQRLRSLATTLLVCFIWSLLLPVAVFADTDESDSTAATAASSAQLRTYTRPRITHPADGAVVSGKVEVRITSNAPKDSNVVLLLDGRLRAISNVPPFVFELDTDKMTEGAHTLQAQVYLANGDRTNSTISTIQVGSPPVFKTTPFPQPAERPIVSKIEVPVSAALPTRSEEPPLTAQADLVRLSQEAVSLLQPTRIARTPGPSTTTAVTHQVKTTQSPRAWKMDLTAGSLRESSPAVTTLETVHRAAPSVSQAEQYCRLPRSIQQSLVQTWQPRVENQALSLSSPTVSGKKTEANAAPSVNTIIETPQAASVVEHIEQQPVPSKELELHRVAEGDCLFSIARRYGTSITALSQANAIGNVDRIRTGDQLWIPSYPTLHVDGKPLLTQPGPFFHQGKLMVPLRATVEACGGSVHWDAETRQVRFTVSGSTVVIGVGESQALRNDRVLALDGKVIIREDRSFVPLESLREMAALPIRYEPDQNRIEIARLPR